MTLKEYNQIPNDSIIAKGIVPNSHEGITASRTRKGDNLIWIAKKSYYGDWAIYIHWEEKGEEYVLDYGDKVYSIPDIKKLLPCDDEVMKLYRF
jgi:hypothetical protein